LGSTVMCPRMFIRVAAAFYGGIGVGWLLVRSRRSRSWPTAESRDRPTCVRGGPSPKPHKSSIAPSGTTMPPAVVWGVRTILVPRTRSPLALTRLGPIRSGVRSVVAALVASIVMLLGAVVHAQTLEFAAVLGATAAANAQGAPASDGGVAGRFTVSLAGARVNGTTVGASLGYSL